RIIGLYLILYPLARFAVEFLRAHDQPNPFGWLLTAAQWITLGLLPFGLWLWRRASGSVVPPKV
ncbi:MAG TPA: prolipoprotein diacylglyceryl transferase family protein, partial [Bryobacteraceae bacterium]|nr:prolipoprotein diacylglyceryl transferase family protein [Bryobacteraceae bacterium]